MKKYILRKKKKQDAVFNSLWFLKFLNCLLKQGKKLSCEKKINLLVLNFKKFKSLIFRFHFFEVLELVKPSIYLRSIMRGKNEHHIPVLLSTSQKYQRSIKIIIFFLKKHKNINFYSKINKEVLDILLLNSSYNEYFEQYISDASKSRAFMHYRW